MVLLESVLCCSLCSGFRASSTTEAETAEAETAEAETAEAETAEAETAEAETAEAELRLGSAVRGSEQTAVFNFRISELYRSLDQFGRKCYSYC
jgi:hypothetical protein